MFSEKAGYLFIQVLLVGHGVDLVVAQHGLGAFTEPRLDEEVNHVHQEQTGDDDEHDHNHLQKNHRPIGH